MNMFKKLAHTAAAVVVATAGLTVVSSASPAAAASCPTDHVCLYYGQSYEGGMFAAIPDSWLYDCATVSVLKNVTSSVYNNTRYAFQLWDVDRQPNQLLGTMARYRGYTGLGAGDNKLDKIISPGCIIH